MECNMEFLNKIKLIQGGMGVYVSNWRLAKAVSSERPGITAGTVSGTALDVVHVRLLQLGDPGGHLRRALAVFDERFGVEIGKKICERFFIEGGKAPKDRYKYGPVQTARLKNGNRISTGQSDPAVPHEVELDEDLVEILIATAFAEVWLAKEGHAGNILINFLKKIELPLVFAMYGAMLAGVNGFIVGAGNPEGLPAICSQLAQHAVVTTDLPVLYRESGETFSLSFDPRQVAGGKLAIEPLPRPAFLAIVSLENLVEALAHSPSQPPDGFIIEHHTAGGHNAAPQGPLKKDTLGQPIYSELDEPDLTAIRGQGLPFWLAGGYGSGPGLQKALAAGAVGVQVGSAFALCEDSGMSPVYRNAIFAELRHGKSDAELVQTSTFSPTGFPFKVVQLEGTLATDEVYANRKRICDLGFLRNRGLTKADEDGTRQMFQRCSAAPIDDFVGKRGLPVNAEEKRCLCNGLLATVGLGQVGTQPGEFGEEPPIVTLGNHLDGIRRLSRQGQIPYYAKHVVEDILGPNDS
jgi:NAD(P)H-dependent flavin oxidoreductase YrpB (nitropropane dioxygenase family)